MIATDYFRLCTFTDMIVINLKEAKKTNYQSNTSPFVRLRIIPP